MSLTVGQALDAFAELHGVPAADVVRAKISEHLEASLPTRYRLLAREVFLRLPDGWDSHAHWTMCAVRNGVRGGLTMTASVALIRGPGRARGAPGAVAAGVARHVVLEAYERAQPSSGSGDGGDRTTGAIRRLICAGGTPPSPLLLYVDEHDRQATQQTLADLVASTLVAPPRKDRPSDV